MNLAEEEDYNDNKDKIKSVDAITLTGIIVNNGTSVYYFQPRSADLARALTRALVRHLGLRDLARHVLLARVRLHRLDDPGVIHQPVDEHLALRELERADADVEPRVDLVDHAVHAPAQQEAHARDQQPLEHRPSGDGRKHRKEPEGKRDRVCHGITKASRRSSVFSLESGGFGLEAVIR